VISVPKFPSLGLTNQRGGSLKSKCRIVGATAAFIAASAIALPVAHAEGGDQRPCVTRGEYRAVHRGLSKARVHAIFDTKGKRQAISWSGGYASEIRSYKTCRRYSAVSVAYDKKPGGAFRLSAKSAVWSG
jgi:hypothetical protein